MRLSQLSQNKIDEGLGKYLAAGALGVGLGLGSLRLSDDKIERIQQKLSRPLPKQEPQYHPQTPKPEIETLPDNLRMNDPSTREYLEFTAQWEAAGRPGRPGYAYTDYVKDRNGIQQAIPTIGYGFNLNRKDAVLRIKNLLKGNQTLRGILDGKQPLDREQMLSLSEPIIQGCMQYARQAIPNFHEQPEEVKKILVDMIYQLGPSRFNKFIEFRRFIIKKNYKKAAAELANSLVLKQSLNRTKDRIERLLNVIK